MKLQSIIVCVSLAFTAAPYLVRGDKNAINVPSPEEGTSSSLTDSPTPFDQMEGIDQSLTTNPRTSANAFNLIAPSNAFKWISNSAWYEYFTRSTQPITLSKEEQFQKKKEQLTKDLEALISVYNAIIVGDDKAEKIFPIQALHEVMESLRLQDRWTDTWDQFVSHCNDVLRQTIDKMIEIEVERKDFRDTLVDVETKMKQLRSDLKNNVIKNFLLGTKARFDELHTRFNKINELGNDGSIESLKEARNLFDSFDRDWRKFEVKMKPSRNAAPPGLLVQPQENNVEMNLFNHAESYEENHEENQVAVLNDVREASAEQPGSSRSSTKSTMTYVAKKCVAIHNILGYIAKAHNTWQNLKILIRYGTFVVTTFQFISSGGGMPSFADLCR